MMKFIKALFANPAEFSVTRQSRRSSSSFIPVDGRHSPRSFSTNRKVFLGPRSLIPNLLVTLVSVSRSCCSGGNRLDVSGKFCEDLAEHCMRDEPHSSSSRYSLQTVSVH